MNALVSGANGFIGSHLTERLLAEGAQVRAVDCLTDFYDSARKSANLAAVVDHPNLEIHHVDLATTSTLPALVDGVDVVFHLAGQPGVRQSWETAKFASYVHHNVTATRALLDAVTNRAPLTKFVFASSSSVYASDVDASTLLAPSSPYGATKLAAEGLCHAYSRAHSMPLAILRPASVYGPRQRPDMLISRLFDAALDGTAPTIFGDGHQTRPFTYVDDVVTALIQIVESQLPDHTTYDVSSDDVASVHQIVAKVAELCGLDLPPSYSTAPPGDVRAVIPTRSGFAVPGWKATVGIDEGLLAQLEERRR